MKIEKKIELLEAVSELLHTEGHEPVYDGSEPQIFWDARTFVELSISRIKISAPKAKNLSRQAAKSAKGKNNGCN